VNFDKAWIDEALKQEAFDINQPFFHEEDAELTALTYACQQYHSDMIGFLMDRGAVCTETCLEDMCYLGEAELVTLLLEKGAVPTEAMLGGACGAEQLDVAKVLIERGVRPTPEMLEDAIIIGNQAITELLSDALNTRKKMHTLKDEIHGLKDKEERRSDGNPLPPRGKIKQ
jgi:hypothetical protein